MENVTLHLEDGSTYKGKVFGASKSVAGEVGKYLIIMIVIVIIITCRLLFLFFFLIFKL